MGEADIRCAEYFEDNKRFADLMNFRLFGGKQVIEPNELAEADSDMYSSLQKRKRKKKGKQSLKSSGHVTVDKAKLWKGQCLRLLIQEYQSYVDYAMVLRCMRDEMMAYDTQLRRKRREHHSNKDLSKGEHLSGIKKEDRFVPVITVVVSLADKKWDGAITLYELLDFADDTVRKYVSDHRINLLDYHDYENFDSMKTEVRQIFEVLKCREDKDRLYELVTTKDEYGSLDDETADLIEELSDLKIEKDKGGTRNMCKAVMDMKAEARKIGEKIGEKRGEKRGIKKMQAIVDAKNNEIREKDAEILKLRELLYKQGK